MRNSNKGGILTREEKLITENLFMEKKVETLVKLLEEVIHFAKNDQFKEIVDLTEHIQKPKGKADVN